MGHEIYTMSFGDIITRHVSTDETAAKKEDDPPWQEWYFGDDCKLPEEELDYCLWYEFGRESDRIREKFAEWQAAKAKNDLLRARGIRNKLLYDFREYHRVWDLYILPFFRDHFPKTPWQAIPKNERKTILKIFEEFFHTSSLLPPSHTVCNNCNINV